MAMNSVGEPACSAESESVERHGLSAEALLRAKMLTLDPEFPTRDCLSPSTVAAFSQGDVLTAEEKRHLDQCKHCAALLSVVEPDEMLLREFRRSAERRASVSSQPVGAWEKLSGILARQGFEIPAAYKIAAPILAVLCVGVTLPSFGRWVMERGDTSVQVKPFAQPSEKENVKRAPWSPMPPADATGFREASLEVNSARKTLTVHDVRFGEAGQIAPESQAKVAAAVAVISADSRTKKVEQKNLKEVGESLETFLRYNGDPKFYLLSSVNYCSEFAKAWPESTVIVSRKSGSDDCIAHTQTAKLDLNVVQGMNALRTMQEHQGNLKAVDDALPLVNLKVKGHE